MEKFAKLLALLLFVILTLPAESHAAKKKIRYCQGGRFAACVCWEDVSKDVSYRPSLKECGGNAAVLTRGKYKDIFSVVVRDSENRDRWPVSGFNGCSHTVSTSISPPAKCSAFKVQKILYRETAKGLERINCLGARGSSTLFAKVTRMTAKLADAPGSTNDPLARWCLRSPKVSLN